MHRMMKEKKEKFLVLPGDLLKLTITSACPCYVKLDICEVPIEDRVHCEDIHFETS